MQVIDTHVRPALYKMISMDMERFIKRCDEMNYHLMKPGDLELLKKQYDLAEMKNAVLLPQDCSAETGFVAISNEEIYEIVKKKPDFFVGFACVDPRKEDAEDQLRYAFEKLKLSGLYLNPARLKMYPADPHMMKLYDICKLYNKPIIFNAGMTFETNALTKYGHPMEFEEVAIRYPEIKICLAHFGWPWVNETAALLVKYENVYANTAMMYMDSPALLMEKVFHQDMGRYWLDHNFCDKVMFGSDTPRIRPIRIKRGLDMLEMPEDVRRKVYYENAICFLGLEE